jgi:hypothetical protein
VPELIFVEIAFVFLSVAIVEVVTFSFVIWALAAVKCSWWN